VNVVPLLLSLSLAWAQDLVVAKYEDIPPLLPPKDATRWDPAPLVAAIGKSTFPFTPNHYYALLDLGANAEVLKIVAAKAAVFYDPKALPIAELARNARAGQPKATIPIGSGNFVELFEFFNDVKNDIDGAVARIGPAAPRGPSESSSLYERRIRGRQEDLVRAVGPFEGRAEATTFQVTLPATVQERDGCKRSVASVDMTDIEIALFRTGMGTIATVAPVQCRSCPTVETVRFTLENPRRFEAIGRCGTTGSKLSLAMNRSADGTWTGLGGF
jgi:hypothetical protein